jgi:hypothetical protein
MTTTCALENVKTIYVLSKSAVKEAAVKRWLRLSRRNWMQVFYIDSQPTDCPQPFGKHSAMQCLFKRLPPLGVDEVDTMYVGIENFIAKDDDGRWRDKVAVAATYVTRNGLLLHTAAVGQFDNIVPRRFEPRTLPDILKPLGYSETVGARIHAADADIAHDNWATAVSPANVDRVTQVVDALRCLDEKLNSFVRS